MIANNKTTAMIGIVVTLFCAIAASSEAQTSQYRDPISQAMDAAVRQDSAGWVWNRYDPGSMSNVSIEDEEGISVAYGEYTYNGGIRGWVKMRFDGENIQCVEFHDFAGSCRPVGQNPARASVGLLLAGALSGDGTGSSGGSERTNDAVEFHAFRRNQQEIRCQANGGC